ncbi:MAG: glycoside hydrolase family 88 protein [Bacteroidetes bacterium]|nr:glycoside hydrolase family 88 protein [Bacteroidota bacterium]
MKKSKIWISVCKKNGLLLLISFLMLTTSGFSNSGRDKKIIDPKLSWAERMTLSQMFRNKDSLAYNAATRSFWNYDKGTYLKGVEAVWKKTGNLKYFNYIQSTIGSFIDNDGSIKSYKVDEYNIDQINSGKLVLTLWKQTKEEKYKKAAFLLKEQLNKHPRTNEGGFWHKKRYPYQMWLDGLYMGDPFYAQFSKLFDQPQNFDDVANQIIWVNNHTRDPKTGLLYHAWDESKQQRWADKTTGCSPNFWSRAMGWYMMAIVDVLDYLPKDHPKRDQIIKIFKETTDALIKVQDKKSGVWYQIPDQGTRSGNYLEASASCMFVYSIEKAINNGYLPKSYVPVAKTGWNGLLKTFIRTEPNGVITLTKTCRSAGLGGEPYRDGSFEYYMSEPAIDNDLKGVGPFIMAAVEAQNLGLTK